MQCIYNKLVERGEKIRVVTAYDLDAGQKTDYLAPALARGVKR
jgi:hypothetical protein